MKLIFRHPKHQAIRGGLDAGIGRGISFPLSKTVSPWLILVLRIHFAVGISFSPDYIWGFWGGIK